jgi:hypothetical protein
VGRSVDEIAGIFLRDLGLTHGEEGNYREAELMDDYLPAHRQYAEPKRYRAASPAPFSKRRFTAAEGRILKRAKLESLIQDTATELVGRGIEKSMEEARRAVANFFESTEVMLEIVDAARTDKHRVAMEHMVDRVISDRGQTLAHSLNMADRQRAKLIEESVVRMTRAADERAFWDNMLGR